MFKAVTTKLIFIVLTLLVVIVFARTISCLPASVPVQPSSESLHEEATDGFTKRLSKAISFKTVSSNNNRLELDAEFGRLYKFIRCAFPLIHKNLSMEAVGNNTRLYKWQGSNSQQPPIVFLAHFDVVPVEDKQSSQWKELPFSGLISDGYIWGRGTLDFKSGAMGILEAVEALLSAGFAPKRTIYLMFGGDEEVGGKDGSQKVASLFKSRGIFPDAVFDEGGALIEGIVPGTTTPFALVGLAEKGQLTAHITVNGSGGHASMPPKHSAIGSLASVLSALEKDGMPAKITEPTRTFVRTLGRSMPFFKRMVFANLWLLEPFAKIALENKPSTNALIRTTTAETMLTAGVKDNVLAQEAKATVNFRILPGDSVEQVKAHINSALAELQLSYTLEFDSVSEATNVAAMDTESFVKLAQSVGKVFPGVVLTPGLTVTATDSRHFASISKNIYRFAPFKVNSEELKSIHGSNERISIRDYGNMINFYETLIRQY